MPPLAPHLTSHSVSLPSLSPSPATHHIFFITGNPGCIGYYHSFLSLLSKNLSSENISIYGHSLANFVDDPPLSHAPCPPKHVLGLQGQIDCVERILESYADANDLRTGGNMPRVILVGHSVGAYIGLEILRRSREKGKKGEREVRMRIMGYVGLWPTVTWIGRSPSGRKLGRMARIPYFAKVVGALARGLTAIVPRSALKRFLQFVTQMPEDAAEVTMQFLSSRWGVEQALHMARDEMLEITEDRWDEDIWGTASASEGSIAPKLIFYFGQSDHWVADHTRDELIAARGFVKGEEELWKPEMLIDDQGIPHGFCIRHSSVVARKTADFVREIIQADRTRGSS